MEDKSQRFKRLAEARTNRAIDAISSLGKLSNRAHYEFDEKDIKGIVNALKSALDETRFKFEVSLNVSSRKKFQLREGEEL